MPEKTPKTRAATPPNILIAARIQRLLSALPVETQRSILEFTLRCLEESQPEAAQ